MSQRMSQRATINWRPPFSSPIQPSQSNTICKLCEAIHCKRPMVKAIQCALPCWGCQSNWPPGKHYSFKSYSFSIWASVLQLRLKHAAVFTLTDSGSNPRSGKSVGQTMRFLEVPRGTFSSLGRLLALSPMLVLGCNRQRGHITIKYHWTHTDEVIMYLCIRMFVTGNNFNTYSDKKKLLYRDDSIIFKIMLFLK